MKRKTCRAPERKQRPAIPSRETRASFPRRPGADLQGQTVQRSLLVCGYRSSLSPKILLAFGYNEMVTLIPYAVSATLRIGWAQKGTVARLDSHYNPLDAPCACRDRDLAQCVKASRSRDRCLDRNDLSAFQMFPPISPSVTGRRIRSRVTPTAEVADRASDPTPDPRRFRRAVHLGNVGANPVF